MNLSSFKNKFITFEGVEGSGKSTQSKMLVDYLNSNGIKTVWTREPGGCPEAEEIRNVLISGSVNKFDGITELLLMYASRRIHTERKIKPLLKDGYTVVSDRYFDSTFAYQGFGSDIDLDTINVIKNIVLKDFEPNITIVLDIDTEKGLIRANKRGDTNRFEAKELQFHQKVRNGFIQLTELYPNRCILIDVNNLSREEIFDKIINIF